MTTTDPILTGRFAALRRPLAGAALAACLLGAAVPAFAQSTVAAGSVAPSSAVAAPAAAAAVAVVADPTAGSAAVADPAAGGSRIQRVLKRALALLGTPYRWGGTTTAGFDCSGLVGYVFRTTLGIELPRVSREMVHSGERVDRGEMTPGDLVFFGRRGKVDHVGIYLGEGRFVHAPRTGRDVTVSSLDGGYWGGKFVEARRVAGI